MAENYYEKQVSKIEYYENKINELKNQHKIYVKGYTIYNIERVAKIESSIRYYEDKIKAIKNNTSINSDNPDAIDLLELKLEKKKTEHAKIKEYNAKLREYSKKGENTNFDGFSEKEIEYIKAGRSIPTYQLTYLKREISDITKKIERLKKLASDVTQKQEYENFTVVDNVEENRVQIFVDEETGRNLYKTFRSYGFVFSRTNKAYQRKRGNAAYATKRMIEILKEHYKNNAA